ncbi:MAG: DNA polymerase II, partial [Thermoplasmata archaeon]
MEQWDVRILTGDYVVEDGEPVVELFGRTREGRSIVIRFRGFKPYFHVVAPPHEVAAVLGEDPEVLGIDEIKLLYQGAKRTVTKVTIRIPKDVPKYRSRFQGDGKIVLAADIPFQHRFIYDMDLASCLTAHGKEVSQGHYTTEIVMEAEKFEDCEPFKPPLKILSFDIENSLKDGRIFTICCFVTLGERSWEERLRGEEKEILRTWAEVIKKHDPDIITGYNIDGYDLPIILERAGKYGMGELPLGRNLKALKQISGRFWRLNGRIIADAWWNVKKELRPKKETLSQIADILLNDKKKYVDPKKIDYEWEKDPDRVVEYCLQD